MKTAIIAALLLMSTPVHVETVACHVTYGGETRLLRAASTALLYNVPVVPIGSYFLFKLVFEERIAIKTYVYADRDTGPRPLHQAVFAYPPINAGINGFSGKHFVYEPVRDGEMEYWCELE